MDALDPEMAAFIHQELRQQGIKLYLGEMVDGLTAGPKVKVHLASQKELDADLVILAIGVRPEVKLARDAGLEIGTRGGIITNPSLQTTDPDIYAVGDAIEVKNPLHEEQVIVPLAGPANKQGRIAADHIQGRDVEYRGSMGTAIVKVFDLAAGSVGSNEKSLKARNVPYHSCIVHPLSHAGYYPGGSLLSIKLLFDPQGKILGGQVVGAGGVDKRIDVLATAMHFGGTVWDLTKLEHAYAPPFSSAKDPVNMAGFVAGNILSADVATINWDQIQDLDPEQSFILDVREPEEYEAGHIPGSTLVPLNSLREHLDELPRDKEIIVYCRVGLRAYLGARILMQHGFEKVKNLSGGYITYSTIMSDLASKLPPPPAGTIAHNEPGTASKLEEGQVPESIVVLDACGLQCPGPIRLVFEKMKELSAGDYLEVHATDPGFIIDLESWSQRTGNQLLATGKENGKFVATLRKGSQEPALEKGHDKTLIVFSSELDRAIASLVIATGAASMRRKVTMFFTFWGLNVLRKPEKVAVQKQGLERAFGWMMPRGSKKLGLSKMNMLGIGPRLIRKVMAKKNVDSLEALLGQAKLMGVRLVACQMSMDVMGIKPEELIDGVEIGGVATYLAAAETSDTNLFI
jgi:peroxiredoxin family protein/rhodanese-related sulfurtransferase/TusA-related sulfurtransferase